MILTKPSAPESVLVVGSVDRMRPVGSGRDYYVNPFGQELLFRSGAGKSLIPT
jgi:hypothetical protein